MFHLNVLQTIVDSGLLILIWLVQVIIYPAFYSIKQKVFIRWHYRYTGLISLFVVPLIGLQALVELFKWNMGIAEPMRIILIASTWVSTFLFSVPCHRTLQKSGYDQITIKRLILTNWPRTILWTILFGHTVAPILFITTP